MGLCQAGTQTCNAEGTAYGPCMGEVVPQTESCSTTGDDNCDGQANEGCVCVPNAVTSCYSGPAGTAGVGLCKAGTQTCNAQGTALGPCTGEVLPQPESCSTTADDNCDGQANEGCVCVPNAVVSCYSGPAGTAGVGICKAGTQMCNAQGTALGPCMGEVVPQPESCSTTADDNCDGHANEGCVCVPNAVTSCYSGPAGTAGVGACKAGTQTCNAQGTALGPCTGEVLPQPEACATVVDDNCDGQVNEGCACVPGAMASCYSGPAGTSGVGICQAGTQVCNAQGTGYGPCSGQTLPQPVDSCNTPADENCDGQVNDGCGVTQWSLGAGDVRDDEGFAVTTDASGNVIIGGYTNGTPDFGCGPMNTGATMDALYIAKLDSAGHCLWNKSTGTFDSQVYGLATDAAGNIYVTGTFLNSLDFGCGAFTVNGAQDYYLAKLSPSGTCLWSTHFGNAGDQEGKGVTVDAAGRVYVVGTFTGNMNLGAGLITSQGSTDIFVSQIAPSNGFAMWTKSFGDASAQTVTGIAHDSAGNIVITGGFVGSVNFGGTTLTSAGLNDIYLAKLDSSGGHVWSKSFGDTADQVGNGVAVDASNNVLLTGSLAGTANFGGMTVMSQGATDAFVAKFTAAGVHVWSKGLGAANTQIGVAVGCDTTGNVFLTGVLDGTADFGGGPLTSAGADDIFLVKLDPSGAHLWSRSWGAVNAQLPRSLAVDPSGSVLVSGAITGATDFGQGPKGGFGGEDAFVVKVSP